jgi:MFS family permease
VDRFFDGAFSVGIWVSCETILLARAERDMKARVTSLYAVSIAIGYVVGPLIAEGIIHVATMGDAFWVSGALAVLATLLVVLRLDPDPAVAERNEEASQPDADRAVTPQITLLRRIKTSCFATFAYGYFQSSVIPFLPPYLVESKGIDRKVTILVPFFFALGMLLFSNVAGRLGDRLGHLLVMRALGAVGTSMILGFVALQSFPLMAIAVFVAGATLASISPVSLALQGVVTEPRDYNRSNAIYNAFYALGMLAGPCVSSLVFARLGGGAMLIHLAGLWIAFVLFTILFRGDDPAFRATPSGDASALGVGAVGNAASLRCEAVQIGPSHQVRVRLDEA